MFIRNNPVLQHELLTNLRMSRAFLLLFAYIALLGSIVYLAWPQKVMLDLTDAASSEAQNLVNLFFLGQFMLASMMAPSFASSAITGEKERNSFEMLLASPIRPSTIIFGKLFASLYPLGILIICSLPIVVLCLPLGGVSVYDVFGAYYAMFFSILLYGMISLWASSYFHRTSAALVVSYMMILPLAIISVLLWNMLQGMGEARLTFVVLFMPVITFSLIAIMWADARRRLIYPSDLGEDGTEVVNLETEAKQSVGLYINRNEWPDSMFAPPMRDDLIEDGTNPIFDKEIRSEIFSQGTLMLRLVIMISMGLAIPMMGICLYIRPWYAPWYIAYVVLFNILVGPVFSAGSVCSERERQTLDLLLTTLITPWQMLWGKLLSGLRVSSVLTSFLLWPVFLSMILPTEFWSFFPTMFGYILIVAICCVTTAMTALFCSTIFHKTITSLICTYLTIIVLFLGPLATTYFAETYFPNSPGAVTARVLSVTSPFVAAFSLPLRLTGQGASAVGPMGDFPIFVAHLGFSVAYNGILLLLMIWLFNMRWRVSETL